MAVDGPEPPGGAGEEREGRHEDEGEPVDEAPEPRRDEAEVVVEGEPAHEDVAGRRGKGPRHRVEAREHVAVGEHHPLRLPGAPGGVLEERDVVRAGRVRRAVAGVSRLGELAHRRDPAASRHPGREQARHLAGLVEGDEPLGAGVLEDPLVPAEVVLELGEAGRRVDGKRDPSRELGPDEAPEVVDTGREHDRDRAAGGEAAADEPGRDPARALEERTVGEHRFRFGLVDEPDVLALRVLRGMPREGLDQGLGLRRDRVRIGGERGPARRGGPGRYRGRSGSPGVPRVPLPRLRSIPGVLPVRARCRGPERIEGTEEVPRGLGLGQHPVREARARRPLEAREELHPREAVEAEVPREIGIEIDGGSRLAGAELARDVGDEGDQGVRIQAGGGAGRGAGLFPAPPGPLLAVGRRRCRGRGLVRRRRRIRRKVGFGPGGHRLRSPPRQPPWRSRLAASSTAATIDW